MRSILLATCALVACVTTVQADPHYYGIELTFCERFDGIGCFQRSANVSEVNLTDGLSPQMTDKDLKRDKILEQRYYDFRAFLHHGGTWGTLVLWNLPAYQWPYITALADEELNESDEPASPPAVAKKE